MLLVEPWLYCVSNESSLRDVGVDVDVDVTVLKNCVFSCSFGNEIRSCFAFGIRKLVALATKFGDASLCCWHQKPGVMVLANFDTYFYDDSRLTRLTVCTGTCSVKRLCRRARLWSAAPGGRRRREE
jgi:hypothetical protein